MKYICVIPVHKETAEVFCEAFFSMYFQCKKYNIPIHVALDNCQQIETIDFVDRLVKSEMCICSEFDFGNLSKVLNWYFENYDFDYMIRMDADDISHPDRIKNQLEYLAKHNYDIDVLGTEMFAFWDNKFDQSEKAFEKIHGEIPIPQNENYWIINHPTAIIKRESAIKIGLYNEAMDLHDGQDTDLWMRMYKNGFVVRNVPEVLLKYRRPLRLKNH